MIDRNLCENVPQQNVSLADLLDSPASRGQSRTMPVEARTRALLMSVRQALIMVLGSLEDYLGMPRSIVPRRKKQ